MEVLHEVSVEFPETKQFIGEHLEQKCLKRKYVSGRGSLYFFYKLSNKELAQKTFFINILKLHVLGFKAKIFILNRLI